MNGVWVVGLQHGLTIDQNLPGRGLKDGGEGLSAGVLAGQPYRARPFRFGVGTFLVQDQAIAALGLAARAQLELKIAQQFLRGKEEAVGAASFELELGLTKLAAGLACAHRAIIYGELDLAALRLDLAGRALNDGFKYGVQCGSIHGLLHDALDLLVGNLGEVGFLAGHRGFQLHRVRYPVDDVLICFDRLQPATVLLSQPKRDTGGAQIMLGLSKYTVRNLSVAAGPTERSLTDSSPARRTTSDLLSSILSSSSLCIVDPFARKATTVQPIVT